MTGLLPPAFSYREGELHVESVPVRKLAEETGTPFYVYSTQQIQNNYALFANAFKDMNATVHFANKSCPNVAIIRTLALQGAGADITSIGELERALQAGIPPEKIIFSGVGKTEQEIMAALLAGIFQINAESLPEVARIAAMAKELGRKAPIALRVNPDVDARTMSKIATGHKGAKFGIDLDQLDEALGLATSDPHLAFKGFSVHIGSHVADYEPFREGYGKLAALVKTVRRGGITVERLDLGGGVGIPYDDKTVAPFSAYASVVHDTLSDLECALAFEPGRRLVGDTGLLIARVVTVKETAHTTFVILDTGMNDLVRPAMYGARHTILPVRQAQDAPQKSVTIVGPICESSDSFGEAFDMPPLKEGDLLAILQAGAYGAAMASTYNGRALVPEVLVSEAASALIRRRISVAEQITWEAYPAWNAASPKG